MKTLVSGLMLAVALSVFAQGQEAPARYYSGIAQDLGKDIPWVARHDMTSESFAAESQTRKIEGYRLYSVSASPRLPNYKDVRFAAIWVKDGKALDWVFSTKPGRRFITRRRRRCV